jgi:hypothetical protein
MKRGAPVSLPREEGAEPNQPGKDVYWGEPILFGWRLVAMTALNEQVLERGREPGQELHDSTKPPTHGALSTDGSLRRAETD